MTHPTDEELNALVALLDCGPGKDRRKAVAALTALPAHVAAANARADRAEAALAAQPHDPAKVQALVEAASALERNLGINGVNVGSLRVNLFAALAAMKEG